MKKSSVFSRRDFLKASRLAAAGTLIAACQPAAPTAVPELAKLQPTATAEIKKQAEVSAMFWDGPPLIGIREKALTPFSQAVPECKMNFMSAAEGYNDKLLTMIAGGKPPDVFIITISELPLYLSKGLLLDLKPFIDRDNYNLAEFPELAIKSYTYKGGIYGMPDNVASMAMFYNKEMFDKEGLKYPTAKWDDSQWTVDDFMNACEKLTKKDANGKTTQYAVSYATWGQNPWIWTRMFGGQLVDDPLKPTECTLDQPGAIAGLQFLQDLVYKYGYAPQPEALAEMGTNDLLLTKKLAMVDNGSWFFPTIRGADFPIDVGHYPKGPGGRTNYVFYFPLVIPKNTPNPDCAWELLKYFNGPAMEIIIKEGGLQGTSLSAQRKWFLSDKLPPEHKEVFVDSVEHFVAPDPVLSNFPEISQIIAAELGFLWTNDKPAKDVCISIKKQIDPLIKQGMLT